MPHKKENIDIEGKVFTFKILRFDSRQDQEPYFTRFNVIAQKGMTVLEALFKIQEDQDPSLVFRYSCRGAVCGSCGMYINGHPNLACRVQLSGLPSQEVLVEPLPNFEIIKDLIVDMDPFWKAYRKVEPWLMPEDREKKGEHLVTEKNRNQIDQFVGCILCACCYGSCPVVSRDEDYAGPAALAKLFRFIHDSRDKRDWKETFKPLNNEHGLWGCDTVFRCVDACPKQVRPTDGIEGLRRRAVCSGKGHHGTDKTHPSESPSNEA
jgi:succinate dehydrogenase / fumarate reductase iron-sulfur subunit